MNACCWSPPSSEPCFRIKIEGAKAWVVRRWRIEKGKWGVEVGNGTVLKHS